MKRTLIIFFVTLNAAAFGQSPGSVSANLNWWLKSNVGVFENAAANDAAEDTDGVYVWDDQSPSNNNAEQATSGNRPIFRNGAGNTINGYPVLRFASNQFIDGISDPGIGDTESFNIFMVFKHSTWTNGGTNDGNGSYIIDRPPPESNNLISFKMVGDKYFYQRRDNSGNNLGGPATATSANTSSFVILQYFRNFGALTEGIFLNGQSDASGTTPNSNMAAPRIRIGRHAAITNNGLSGDFAEIAIYQNTLTNLEQSRIQSYLAIKYGITLSQSSATDYVRSDGSTIYSATTFAGYLSDVAGIGRDDNAGLLQTAAQSQNANSVIRISNPSNLNNNNEFLVWGSNNLSLSTPNTSDLPAGIVRRLSRVWRTAEPNGNIGNVTVEVDLSAVPGPKTAGNLRLLVDGNGFFAGGSTPYSVTSSSGSVYTFTGVTLNNGNYFTIGSTNIATPLPVELTDFDVTYENPSVYASWHTASELNNEYFTLERAGTDLVFDEIGRTPGAGTSQIPHAYSMIDSNPFDGRSFYRLKQTDFDGTVAYSDMKTIFIEESEKQLRVFPNPNDGKILQFKWGNSPFHLTDVEVINPQGKTVLTSTIEADVDLYEYRVELKHSLPSGLYIVKVHYNGKDEFLKLVVEK